MFNLVLCHNSPISTSFLLFQGCTQPGNTTGVSSNPHRRCTALHPWCNIQDLPHACQCANIDGVTKSCDALVFNKAANICGNVEGMAVPDCACGGDGTSPNSASACDENGTAPNCLTTTNAFIEGDAKSKCQKCKKYIGKHGDGDGTTQGTCPAGKKCYSNGACKGMYYLMH